MKLKLVKILKSKLIWINLIYIIYISIKSKIIDFINKI